MSVRAFERRRVPPVEMSVTEQSLRALLLRTPIENLVILLLLLTFANKFDKSVHKFNNLNILLIVI